MHVSMKYLCGLRPHVVDRGLCTMYRLQVQWVGILGGWLQAHEGPYEDRTGARGCDGLGVM